MPDCQWLVQQTERTQAEAAFRLCAVDMVEALLSMGWPEARAIQWASLYLDVPKGTIRRWIKRLSGATPDFSTRLPIIAPQRGRTGVPNRHAHLRRKRQSVKQLVCRRNIALSLNRLRAKYPEAASE